MTGKMELEKFPRCWAERELEKDVGSVFGIPDRQIEEMLNDIVYGEG